MPTSWGVQLGRRHIEDSKNSHNEVIKRKGYV